MGARARARGGAERLTDTGPRLLVLQSVWGLDGVAGFDVWSDLDAALERVIAAGFDGVGTNLARGERTATVARAMAPRGLAWEGQALVRDAADLVAIEPYRGVADRFLFDAKPPKDAELPGGNGVPFDWRVLAALDPDVGYMLSGGLNAQNIVEALRLVSPAGIDISSGVESAPGVKDVALIEAFFRAVRAAEKKSAA